jgi:Beta-propeller repeat
MPSRQFRLMFSGLTLSLFAACGADRPTINSFALRAAKTQLKPGEEVQIDAVTEGRFRTNRSDDGFGKFVIDSGNEGGTLSAPNGPFTIFRSKADLTDIVTVVINGKSAADESKTDSITLTVTPNLVKSIVVTSSTPAIEPGGTVNLSAMVTGVGTFSSDVVWTIVKGGGTLSANSGAMVTYDGKGVATGSEVEISAVSKMSSNVKASIKLLVVVKPAITSFEATPVGLPVVRTGLPIGGGKAKLAWVVKDAGSVEISPAPGVVQGSSVETMVTQTTEFTLTVKNGPWVVTKAATMKVENQGIQGELVLKNDPSFVIPANGGLDPAEGTCSGRAERDELGNFYIPCVVRKSAAECPRLTVAKYDASQVFQWRVFLTTSQGIGTDCSSTTLELQETGSFSVQGKKVYFFGRTSGQFLTPNATRAESQKSLWAAKVDTDKGVAEWVSQISSPDYAYAYFVGVDVRGNFYAGGEVNGKLGQTAYGLNDAWVAKFDGPTGTVRWIHQFGTRQDDYVLNVYIEPNGDVFATGRTSGNLGATRFGSDDGFVTRINGENGVPKWTSQVGTAGTESCTGVTTDANGSVYASGYTYSEFRTPNSTVRIDPSGSTGGDQAGEDAWVMMLDPANGTPQWVTQFGTTKLDGVGSLAFDFDGSLYVSGYTNGSFTTPNVTQSLGDSDAYIVKLNKATHQPEWVTQFGTTRREFVSSIVVNPGGSITAQGSSSDNTSSATFTTTLK